MKEPLGRNIGVNDRVVLVDDDNRQRQQRDDLCFQPESHIVICDVRHQFSDCYHIPPHSRCSSLIRHGKNLGQTGDHMVWLY